LGKRRRNACIVVIRLHSLSSNLVRMDSEKIVAGHGIHGMHAFMKRAFIMRVIVVVFNGLNRINARGRNAAVASIRGSDVTLFCMGKGLKFFDMGGRSDRSPYIFCLRRDKMACKSGTRDRARQDSRHN